MADYVTLEHRALLMVGTWNASTGTEAITDEDLQAIVAASESGVLDNPVVKIGHLDPRFKSLTEDGDPAYGQITNLSIEDGVLYGDYIHMPRDLAESIDSAYPRSSVELARNVVLRNAEGDIVHEFACVLTANALLGATAPAVKGLSTKMSAVASLSSGTPTYVEIRTAQFSLPGGGTAKDLGERLAAAVYASHSSDAVWAYLEDFTDEKVIFAVEGYGESTYYEQAYTVAGTGASPELVGDPVQVVKETRWVSENRGDTGTVQPQAAEPAHSLSEAPPNAPSDPNQGETPMPTVDKDKAAELRRQYGLASNASYEDLLGAVLEDKSNTAGAPKNVKPGEDETPNPEVREQQAREQEVNPNFSEGDPEEEETEEEKAARLTPPAPVEPPQETNAPSVTPTAPGATSASADHATVSKTALSEFQSRFAALEAREQARLAAETGSRRDNLVKSWYRTGRIGDEDEAKRVRASMDRPGGEEIAVELIGSRAPLFSTASLGHAKAEPAFFAHNEATALEAQLKADDDAFSV